MGTNCTPLVTDYFFYFVMLSLSDNNQAISIEASNSIYLDDLLNIDDL